MGLGPQPSLPLPDSHRRSLPHTIPREKLSPPPPALLLMLPRRSRPHRAPRPISAPLLDPDEWQPLRRCRLGDPTEPLPPRARYRLCRAHTIC